MARKIICNTCDKWLKNETANTGGHYESIEGSSKYILTCDDCFKTIQPKSTCFAGCLLDSKEHYLYPYQKPEVWVNDFLVTTQTTQ